MEEPASTLSIVRLCCDSRRLLVQMSRRLEVTLQEIIHTEEDESLQFMSLGRRQQQQNCNRWNFTALFLFLSLMTVFSSNFPAITGDTVNRGGGCYE